MFQEFFERVTKELTALAPVTMRIKVVAPPEELDPLFFFFWRSGGRLRVRRSPADFPQLPDAPARGLPVC